MFKRALIGALCATALSGCGIYGGMTGGGAANPPNALYKVDGIVAMNICSWRTDTLRLDSGAEYLYTDKQSQCNVRSGTEVTIYHDADLRIIRIEPRGTELVTEEENTNENR